jgi:hypothetical protein
VIQIKDADLGSDAFDHPGVRVRRSDDGGFDVELQEARSGVLGERVLRPLGRVFALPYFLMTRLGEHRSAWAAEPPLFAAGSSPRAATKMPGEVIDAHPVAALLDALHRAYEERVTLFYVPSFDPERPSEPATRTEAFVAERCREQGWSCVSLRSAYPDFARRREAPFGFPNTNWNQGHLNSAGHAAAGELLADEMVRLAGRDFL